SIVLKSLKTAFGGSQSNLQLCWRLLAPAAETTRPPSSLARLLGRGLGLGGRRRLRRGSSRWLRGRRAVGRKAHFLADRGTALHVLFALMRLRFGRAGRLGRSLISRLRLGHGSDGLGV